tara:strand:- start:9842 stop:10069 length:228 start_codon:yes stop_codon:yes gene_type:complete
MTQKGKRGKPTRKDISGALGYIGQKLKYIEEYCIANEHIFELYLDYSNKKDDFLAFVKKTVEEREKKLEKKKETK